MTKNNFFIVLFAGLGFINTVKGTSYHVSVEGSSNGNGSKENPWDLSTALNKKSVIKGGDTLWVHAGTYFGDYKSTLQGSEQSPIIVKAVSDFNVILNGKSAQGADAVLTIESKYVWYCGLTITNSDTHRIETSTLDTKSGINVLGAYNKLINCIIHNNIGNGIGFWSTALESEIYGCIIYHNGYRGDTRGHGHGIYTQNETGTKFITDNIFFNSFGIGIHIYTENGSIKGYKVEGNTFFNSGLPGYNQLERHIIVGGTKHSADRIMINENYFYNKPNYPSKAGVQFGYSAANQNAEFTNNYMVDGTFYCITNWDTVKCTNNSLISKTTQMSLIAFDNYQNIKKLNFNNNQYYKGCFYPVYPPATAQSFEYWKNASNQDNNSVYSSSEPSKTVSFIRKNRYETGRATIVIYNWENLETIDVDLSQVLSQGDEYELFDVSCLSKGAVSKGVYDGKKISISTKLTAVDLPNGYLPNLNEIVHTFPSFGVFFVKRTSENHSPTSIYENSQAQENHHLQIQQVYPNPAEDNLTLTFNVWETSFVDITITDVSAKLLHSERVQTVNGINTYLHNISHLENGVYVITVSDGEKIVRGKFVKTTLY